MKRSSGEQRRGVRLVSAVRCCLLYLTCPDMRTASRIARAVVDAHLAACANSLPGMHSCYRWQGRVEVAREVVLILKTRRTLVPACAALVRSLHPYTVPCLLEIPLQRGLKPYVDWLEESAGPAPAAAQATRFRRSPARKAARLAALSATRR